MKTETKQDRYIIGGKHYIRVTEFLHRVGLSDFSGIPERDREYYMNRGTENHRLWQHIEEGVDSQYTYDPRVDSYRAGHARFLRETGFRALPGGIEKFVHATWEDLGIRGGGEFVGIAGTLDRIGTIQSRVVLADYKTSTVPSSTRIQTALYLLMIPGYSFSEVERYGVAFKPDGTYKMSERYKFSDRDEAIHLVKKMLTGN